MSQAAKPKAWPVKSQWIDQAFHVQIICEDFQRALTPVLHWLKWQLDFYTADSGVIAEAHDLHWRGIIDNGCLHREVESYHTLSNIAVSQEGCSSYGEYPLLVSWWSGQDSQVRAQLMAAVLCEE